MTEKNESLELLNRMLAMRVIVPGRTFSAYDVAVAEGIDKPTQEDIDRYAKMLDGQIYAHFMRRDMICETVRRFPRKRIRYWTYFAVPNIMPYDCPELRVTPQRSFMERMIEDMTACITDIFAPIAKD